MPRPTWYNCLTNSIQSNGLFITTRRPILRNQNARWNLSFRHPRNYKWRFHLLRLMQRRFVTQAVPGSCDWTWSVSSSWSAYTWSRPPSRCAEVHMTLTTPMLCDVHMTLTTLMLCRRPHDADHALLVYFQFGWQVLIIAQLRDHHIRVVYYI